MSLLQRLRGRGVAPSVAVQLIGAPAVPPPAEFGECLRRECALHPEIEEAYVFQTLITAAGEQPQLGVGLMLRAQPDDARLEEIAKDLGDTCARLLPRGELTFQVLTPDTLEAARSAAPPVYTRH
jgi:hypothetical protein